MNDQRKVIYEQRADIMDAEDVSDVIADMRHETVASLVNVNCPEGTYPEQWDVANLKESIDAVLGLQPPIDDWLEEHEVDQQLMTDRLQELADAAMAEKTKDMEPGRWIEVERQILLQTLDSHWKEHLATLDALRQVIHLRSYAQKKPINEYKHEAFLLFERLLISIREEVSRLLMRAQVQLEPPPPPVLPDFITQHLDPLSGDDDTADIDAGTGAILSRLPPLNIPQPDLPDPATGVDAGVVETPLSRNAPCPCGSGLKYKHCHGKLG
jgi:preprotein translocase subunit SecA